MEKPDEKPTRALTEQIMQEQLKDIDKHNPEDIAAVFFQRHESEYVKYVNTLSNRGLKRLCMHLALGPLANKDYKMKDNNEKHAAYIGNELVMERVLMQLSVEVQKAEEAQKQIDAQANEEILNTKSETEGEQTNG